MTEGVECRKDEDVIDENSGSVQAHRRGDGSSGRSGGNRAHASAVGLRQRLVTSYVA